MVKFLEDNVDILIGSKDNKMVPAIVYSILIVAMSFGTAELLISQEGNTIGIWRGSLLIRLLFNVIVTVLYHHINSLDKRVATATIVTILFSMYFKYGFGKGSHNVWFIYFTLGNIWIWQLMDNLENKQTKIEIINELEMKLKNETTV